MQNELAREIAIAESSRRLDAQQAWIAVDRSPITISTWKDA